MEPEAVDHVESLYAPPDDPVFDLVPPIFDHYAQVMYREMDAPTLTSENIWDVYCELLERLEALQAAMDDENYIDCIEQWEVNENLMGKGDPEDLQPYPLIDGLDLRGGLDDPREDGSIYLGGINGGDGLGKFSDYKYNKILLILLIDGDLEKRLDELDENNEDFEIEIEAVFSDQEVLDLDEVDEW